MKFKITKRSRTDKTLVTIPLAQFDNTSLDFVHRACDPGDEVTVVIDGVVTVCILARPDKSGAPTVMTTHAYPRYLRLPRVGHPTYVEISEIR
jgi:hypothetical protein